MIAFVWLVALLTSPAAAFDLQGHRGARGLAPENTLPAFATALGIGVDTLELDTAVTRDGVVVVSHDAALNPALTRGPDGNWLAATGPAIVTLSYEELARYDVGRLQPGTRYAAGLTEQKPADGTHVPRLDDLFALVRRSGNDSVRFNIEIKTDPRKPQETLSPEAHADRLIETIRAAGMTPRSTIQSFDWRGLKRVQAIAPEFATVCLTAQQRWLDNLSDGTWTAGLRLDAYDGDVPRLAQAAGCRIWSPYYGDVDAGKVAAAHQLGLRVVVWTVNQPAEMAAIMALGVDGIITDRPDLLRQVMAERGLSLPQPTPVTP